MDDSVTIDGRNARNASARNGHEIFIHPDSGKLLPPHQWFMHAAHALWGGNGNESPAKWMRSLTGFPDRTCRAYASGDTDVSSAMLYALLRGDQGLRVADRIMDGAPSPWLRELRADAALGSKVRRLVV